MFIWGFSSVIVQRFAALLLVSVMMATPIWAAGSVPASISYPATSATGSYTVTWGASTGTAFEYYLDEKLNSGAWTNVYIGTAGGSRSVSFTGKINGSYTYRVEACSDGVCSAARTGAVLAVSVPAPTLSFSASPASIGVAGSSSLNWTTSNASSCTINGANVAVNGPQIFSPINTTTTYTLNCSGPGGSNSAQTTVTVVPAPTISGFSASPTTIAAGANSVLSWTSSNASSCTINGASVGLNGPQTFSAINASTTYTLSCSGVGGSNSAQATVTVVPAPALTFSAVPVAIAAGASSTLTWTSANASSCGIDGTSVGLNSSLKYWGIAATTTYTLSCSGVGGGNSAQTTVTVVPVPALTLSATPASIATGASSTLNWSASNASSCTINGAGVGVNGPQTYSAIGSTTTYTLSCSGIGGSSTAQATVTVVPVPTISFTATPATIAPGASTTLAWATSNAGSCSVDGQAVAAGNIASGNVVKSSINTTTNYGMSCTGIGGSANSSALVTVVLTPVTTLTVDAALIEAGTTTTVRWTSTNAFANGCTLTVGGVPATVQPSGFLVTANLVANQTYGLQCTGTGGTSPMKTVTVAVAQAWANLGQCDAGTGRQAQLCVNGALCALNSTRQTLACAVAQAPCSP